MKCKHCNSEIECGSIICKFCKSWDSVEVAREQEDQNWVKVRAMATLFYLVERFDNDQQILSDLFALVPTLYESRFNDFKNECVGYMHIDPEKYGMPPVQSAYSQLKTFCRIKSEHFFDILAMEIINKGIKDKEYKKTFFGKNLIMPESLYEHYEKLLKVNFFKRIRSEMKLDLESLNNFLIQKKKETLAPQFKLDEVVNYWKNKIREKGINFE